MKIFFDLAEFKFKSSFLLENFILLIIFLFFFSGIDSIKLDKLFNLISKTDLKIKNNTYIR